MKFREVNSRIGLLLKKFRSLGNKDYFHVMPYKRSKFGRGKYSRRSQNTFRRRVAVPRRRFGGARFRPARFYGRRFGGRGRGGHRKLSIQRIKTVMPDIALSKCIGHHIMVNVPCNDLSTALQRNTVTNNTFTVIMNGNPANGGFYYTPGVVAAIPDTLNPYQTYVTKYATYRPYGCKVSVTVHSQDGGTADPSTQIATPFVVYGFPAVISTSPSTTLANMWNGGSAAGYTADTVPQMKYGFRRISPGMGGKNTVKYSTYWDFAKLLGLTKDQYMAGNYTCSPDDGSTNPIVPICLVLAVADYTGDQTREVSVDIKITQYGRWEGQNPDTF